MRYVEFNASSDQPRGRDDGAFLVRSSRMCAAVDHEGLTISSGNLFTYSVGNIALLREDENGTKMSMSDRSSSHKDLRYSHTLLNAEHPGVSCDGIRLRAGHRYRVVGEYNNVSGVMYPDGAMALMATLMRPDCLRCWLSIDATEPHYMMDLATLPGDGWAGINWLETVASN